MAAADPIDDCARAVQQALSASRSPDSAHLATIVGVVRNGVFGTALSGVRLDVPELNASVCSDSAGVYRLSGLANGAVTVRAMRPGYDPLSVTVTLPSRGEVRVDLTLSPKLVVLDSVRVNASRVVASSSPVANSDATAGTWNWRGDPAASGLSTGEPDLVRTLGADPHFSLRPDWPGGLADRGGTSDQLLVRIDGLPVWNPVHGSGTLSIISPDAISGIDVHDGAMQAAYGDRLGGVVDVSTRDAPSLGWTGAASIGPSAVRATVAQPIAIGNATGGIVVAVRRSNGDLPELSNDAGPVPDRWADGVATASLATGGTALKLVVLASNDRATPNGIGMSAAALSPNAVPWSTATGGLVWTQQIGTAARLESRLSTSRFVTTVPGVADSLGPTLGDGVQQTELSSQLSWQAMTFGVSMDALSVSYRVSGLPTGMPSHAMPFAPPSTVPRLTPLALTSAPTSAAAFIQRRWGPDDGDGAWHITTGVRGMTVLGMTARLEPRVEGGVRVLSGLTLTAGYARTHEVVQSLRNTESPLGVELGVDLPVATSPGGVPLAQSDIGTAGFIASLGGLGKLSVDGYVRALSGLAIANPLHSGVFAATSFARASAHVGGMAASLEGGAGPVTWQAGYGIGRTVESADGVRYHPTSELGETGSAAVGFALDRLTELRFAGWTAFGQRAPGLDVTSTTRDDAAGAPSAGGLAMRDFGMPWATTLRLPPYLRADVQFAHRWRTGPANGRLSTYVTVANIFNHANLVDALPTGPGGSLRGITLLPRTLLVGIGWAY